MNSFTSIRPRAGFGWWLSTLLLVLLTSVATAVPDFRPAVGGGSFLPDDGGASVAKASAGPPVVVNRTYPCGGGDFSVTITYRNPECTGVNDGSIQMQAAPGVLPGPVFVGTAPYQFYVVGPVLYGPFGNNFTLSGLAPGNYSVYVFTGDGCDNVPDPVVVTLVAPPVPTITPIASVPNPPTVCQHPTNQVQLSTNVNIGAPAGNYHWHNAVPPAGLLQNSPVNIYNAPQNVAGAFTYYVQYVPNVVGCTPSNIESITVTVLPAPAAPPVPTANPATPCVGANYTLTVAPAIHPTYRWYDAPVGGNLVATGNPVVFTATPGPNTYWVSAVGANGCEGPRTQVTVNPATPPAPPTNVFASAPQCVGQPITYTAVPAPPAGPPTVQYRWYDLANNLINVGTTYNLTPGIPGPQVVTFAIEAWDGGCASNRPVFNVNINPFIVPGAPTVDNPAPVFCQNQTGATVNIVGPIPGYTYLWYDSPLAVIPVATGTSFTVPTATVGVFNYYVRAQNGGCNGNLTQITVTVTGIQLPTGIATPPTICAGQATNLIATFPAAPPGSFDFYTAPIGGTKLTPPGGVPSGFPVNTGPVFATQFFYVEYVVGTCTSARAPILVTVNPAPPLPTGFNNTPACVGQPFDINATPAVFPPLEYRWYDAGGNLLGAGNTLPNRVHPSTVPVSYFVETVNTLTGCVSLAPRAQYTVAANPLPPMPTAANVTICNGTTATLTATAPGGTYTWWDAPAGGTQLATGASYTTPILTSTTTYYVQTTVAGCTGPRRAVTVTVRNVLNAVATPTDVTGCHGSNTGRIDFTAPTNGVPPYQYSINGGATWQAATAFINLPAGTYNVAVRETTAPVCVTNLGTVTIGQPPILIGTLNNVQNVTDCFGRCNGSIQVSATGGATAPGGYQYSRDGGITWEGGGPVYTFANLCAGTYNVRVRDLGTPNCVQIINPAVVINQPAQLAGNANVVNATCFGVCDGQINFVGVGGGSGFYEFSIDNGGTWDVNPNFGGLCDGNYNLIIRDANDPTCFINLGVRAVTEPAQITANIIVQNITCHLANDGQITIQNTTAQPPIGQFQYSIDGGLTYPYNGPIAVINNLPPGTYVIWGRDSGNPGCTRQLGTVTLVQPNPLSANTVVTNVTGCFNSNNGSITFQNPQGGSGFYEYSLNGGPFLAANPRLNLAPGLYTIQMRDQLNPDCVINLNPVTILGPAELIINGVNWTNVTTCFGNNDGTITVTNVVGGTGVYRYALVPPSAQLRPNQLSPTFTNLPAGNYTVRVTDDNGCTVNANVTITQPGQLNAQIVVTPVGPCHGDANGEIRFNAAVGGSGQYEYSITGTDPADWQTNNVFTNLPPGTYNARIRDLNNPTCQRLLSTNVVVTQPDPLTANPVATPISCNGANDGQISFLTPDGGVPPYQYSITGGPPFQANPNFTGLPPAATYIAAIRDANGCERILNNGIAITEPPVLNADVFPFDVTNCFGGNNGRIEIQNPTGGNGGPYRFSIDGGVTWFATQIFNGLSVAGNPYIVQMRHANPPFCTVTLNTVNLNQPPQLNANIVAVDPTGCAASANGSITFAGAVGGSGTYQYSINGGVDWYPNPVFNNLPAGSYDLRIQDAANPTCTRILNPNFVLTAPPNITANVIPTNVTVCHGNNNGSIEIANAVGGTPPYEYSINGGATWVLNPIFNGLTAGTYNVQVRSAGFPACVTVLNPALVLTQPALMNAIVNKTDVTCNGANDGTITVSNATPTTLTFEYSFDGGGTWQGANTIGGRAPGVYNVQIRDAANPTCVRVVNANLVINDIPVLAATVTPTNVTGCSNANNGRIEISNPTGGRGAPYQFSIDGGVNFTGATTFNGLGPGTYTVQMRHQNAPFCTVTLGTITLTAPAPLTATVVPTNVTGCPANANGTITVTNPAGGSGVYDFSIDGGATWWPTGVFNNLPPGTYAVFLRDRNNPACVLVVDPAVLITAPPAITASVVPTNVDCFGANNGRIQINGAAGGTGTYEYSINGGVGWGPNNDFQNLAPGTYDVRIRALGFPACEVILNPGLVITEPARYTADVTRTNVTCAGANDGTINVVNMVPSTLTYDYSVDGGATWSGLPLFTNLAPGTYNVVIRNQANLTCQSVVNPAVVITEPAALNANVNSTNVTGCSTANNGSIAITSPTGGSGTYTFSIDGGLNFFPNQNYTNLAAGTYVVQMRNASPPFCTVTLATIVITAPAPLNAGILPVNPTGCQANANGSITFVNTTGGSGEYEWSIDDINWQPINTFFNLPAGTYDARVRDRNNPDCFYVVNANTVLTAPAPVSATVTSTHPTCFNRDNGTITFVNPTGGTGTFEYSINGGLDWFVTNTFTDLLPGTYDLRIRPLGFPMCAVTLDPSRTLINPAPYSATINVTHSTCFGQNGTIAISNPLPNTNTYEFSIDGGVNWSAIGTFNVPAGTYDVRIRNQADATCQFVLNPALVVNQPPQLQGTATPTQNTRCAAPWNGRIDITGVAGGSGVYQYTNNNGVSWQNSPNYTNLPAGNYVVQIRDFNNPTCVRDLGTITVPGPVPLAGNLVNFTNPTCNGRNDGTITLAAAGGSGTYEYSINNRVTWQNNPNFVDLTGGTYNIWVRDLNNPSCEFQINPAFVLNQPAVLNATIASTNVTGCFGNTNGTITINGATGGSGVYEYSINGGSTWSAVNTFTNLPAGTYNVQIRSAGDPTCVRTLNATLVIGQPAQLNATVSRTNANCFGVANGTITISAPTGGSGTYEYNINSGVGAWANTGTFTGVAAGSYDVRIRDAANPTCFRVLDPAVVVTQPAQLQATANVTQLTRCVPPFDGRIEFTAISGGSGSYNFSIDGVNFLNQTDWTNLPAGTYNLRIQDALNPTCIRNLPPVVLDNPAAVTANLLTNTPVTGCAGRNNGALVVAGLGGTGLYQYSINGGVNWQNNGTFNGLTAGTYTVRVRDANNPTCFADITATITEPAPLNATVTSTNVTICHGNNNGTITIAGAVGGSGTYEYSINGGATWTAVGSFTNLTAGTYNVQIRSAGDPTCVRVLNATLAITEPAQLNALVTSTDATCFGVANGTITIAGATGGSGTYEYSINGAGGPWQNNGTFNAVAAGVRDVRIRDAANPTCFRILNPNLTINQPAQLNATPSVTQITRCVPPFDGRIEFTAISGGSGTYEFSIDGGTTFLNQTDWPNLGAGTYDLRIRDLNHPACVRILPSVTLNNPAAVTANLLTNTPVTGCAGRNNGSLVVAGLGGTGSYQYSINGGVNWQNNGTFNGLTAGTYTIRVRDAVNPTCFADITATVTEPAPLSALAASVNVTICNGNNNGSITVNNAVGGSGTYEYSINGGASWQTNNVFAGLTAGTYNVQVRSAGDPTCVYTVNANLVLTEPAPLTASYTRINPNCYGATNGSITFMGMAGGSGVYEFNIQGGVGPWSPNATFTGLAAGTYDLRIRDLNNPTCTRIIDGGLVLTEPTQISGVATGTDVTNCVAPFNGRIDFTGVNGGSGTYQYSIDGTTWLTSPNFTNLAPGTYTPRIRDAANTACVVNLPPLVIAAPAALSGTITSVNNVTGCNGRTNGSITISATGGSGTYQYSIDGGLNWVSTTTITGLAAGTYNVQVRDALNQSCIFVINASLTITEPLPLSATVNSTNVTGCHGNANGSITIVGPVGGSGLYEYSVDGGATWQTGNTFNGLPAGVYNVWIRNQGDGSCARQLNAAVTLTQPAQLNGIVASTNINCNGQATGSISILGPSGGSGSYEFSIDGGITWVNTATIGGLFAGTYDVRMRDAVYPACNRILDPSVVLTQPAPLSADVTSTNVTSCGAPNGTISISNVAGGSGNYQYTINGGGLWTTITNHVGLPAGTYIVRLRDANAITCVVDLGNVVISAPAALGGTIASVTNVTGCHGRTNGSITISPTGGSGTYQYSVDGGLTWVNTATITGLGAGIYNVRVRDAANPTCTFTINPAQPITEPLPLSGIVTKTDVTGCFNATNGSISIASAQGAPSYEYSINGGSTWQTANTFTGLGAGTYAIWIRNQLDPTCARELNAALTLTQPAPLGGTVTSINANCYGAANGQITILGQTGGSGNYLFSINGGLTWGTNSTFPNLPAGTYDVRIQDAAEPSCFIVLNNALQITEPGQLNATVSSTNVTTCTTPNGSITITNITGGSGSYQFSINGGVTWTNQTVYNSLNGGTYVVAIRDAAAPTCQRTIANVVISVPVPIVATATRQNVTICQGRTNGSITVNATGGSGSFEYSIDGGGSWQTTALFPNLGAGTYDVRVRDILSPSCAVVVNPALVINEPAPLQASLVFTNVTGCFGNANGSITVTNVSGGSGTYEYSIDGGTNWLPTNAFSGLTAGSYSVRVRSAGDPACFIIVNPNLIISQPPQMSANYEYTNPTCFNGSNGTITIFNAAPLSLTFEYSVNGTLWQNNGTFTGLPAGNYAVQIRDAAVPSCVRILNGNLTLTQPAELNANVTKQNVTSCTSANGSIAFSNIGGGSGAYEFSIDGGNSWSDQLNFNNLPAASYIVLIRDANDVNCFKLLGTYVIEAPTPIIATAITNNVTGCFGRQNGSIIITATGGSGQFEYSINGGNSWSASPSFTNLGAGTYDIRVRDSQSPSCVRIINPSALLTQPAQLNASIVKTDVTGCFGNNDGTITITNPVGGSGNYEFSIDGGASWSSTNAFTGLIAGTYNVRIRNQGDPNCNAIINPNVVITQPQQLSGTVQSTNVTCNGAADGTITFVNVQPTSVTFQYSIDGGASWFSTPNFTGLAPGIYSVRIRNANFLSCVVSLGTLTITQPAALNASVNTTNVSSCAASPNGSISITNLSGGSGAYEISINGGVNWSQSFNFTNLPAGTYVVQIRDANSTACVRSLGSYTLTQPGALSASVAVQDVTGCAGYKNGSITIINAAGGSGVYDYTINGTTWSANPSFTGLGAGTYNVRIRDQLNPSCFFVINPALIIQQPAPLAGTVLQTNVTGCAGNNNGAIVISNPTGGSGEYEFSIDGGSVWQTSNVFNNLVAGVYDVRIRNRNDHTCNEALLIVTLTQPAPITATILSGNPTCYGSTDGFITIAAPANGSGTYQYSINGGLLWSNSPSFVGLGAGTYFVMIRDANNPSCVAILNSSFVLTEPARLQATINKTDVTSCATAPNGSITLSAISGGSGVYQFSIDGGQNWSNSPNFTGLPAGSYDVRIRNASPPQCPQSLGTVTITQPNQLTATVTAVNVTGCNGNNNGRIIIDNTAGGSGNYQYSIDGGLTWPGSGTSYTFNNLPAGVYNVRMRDANALQCVVVLNSALAITEPAVLSATLSYTNPTCNGAANGVIEVSNPVGGSGSFEFSVTGGTNWQPNNVFNGLPANTYTVRIRDLNNPICTATIGTVTLTQPDALNATFVVGDVTGCNGGTNGSITFLNPTGGSGNYEYSINGGLNWSTNTIFSNLSAGSYNLFIRDLLNPLCVRQLQTGVIVGEPAQLVANFTVKNVTGCTGNNNGEIEFTNPTGGSGQFEFSIDGGNTWTRDPIFRNLRAGFYDLRIRDRNVPTCRRTINNNVQLTEPAPLSATASATNEAGCAGANNGTITITNVSGGSGQYYFTIDGGSTWLLGQTTFTGLGPGTYNVRMYDAINPSCIYTINSNLVILPVSPLSGNATATKVTCFGGSNGTITITNVTGGSGTYQYSVRPNEWQSSPVFENLSAGSYLVRVRDAINQNCVFVINNALVVTQQQELDANVTVNAVTGCNGNNNGSIEISNPTGGSGAYRYSINGGASFQASPSFRNLPAGIYTVVIGDAADFNCTRVLATNVRVNEPGVLSAQVRVTPVGCAGGTGLIEVVNASGGSGTYQYSINGGGSYSNSNTFVVRAGVYDVRVRDLVDPNCVFIVSTTVAVSEPAPLNAEVSKTDVTGCRGNFNGTITVSNATGGSGEYEYSFDGGLSWTTVRTRGLLSAGSYDVRIRDRNFPDCFRALQTVTINEPLGITASFTSTGLVCAGASNGVIIFTNVQGGSGQYEYSIDGGVTWRQDNTFTGLPGGTYDLRVRDLGNNSCVTIVNRNVVLFEPAPMTAQVQTVNVQGCSNLNNGQIRITNPQGGSGGYQFSLNGGGWQTTNVFTDLPTGIYTLRMRDAANTSCVVTIGTFTIFGPTELSARISLDQITCNGGTGVLTITNPQGGSGQYRYSIDGGNTWFTSPRFNVRAGQYDVRIQDLNFLQCVQIINPTFQVTEPGRLNATLVTTNVSGCNGAANGSIQFTNQTGGSGVYEYSINGGLTWSSSPIFNNLTAGNYNVRMRDANDIQCDVLLRLTLQITEPARITATFTKTDVDCADASNGSIQFTNPQGGSGQYEYSINGGVTWQTSPLFANIPGGLYDLRIREASTPTCVSIVASRVEVREPAQLNANVTTTPEQGCEGNRNGTMTFSNAVGGSGGYQFSLNNGPWLLGPTVTGLAAGFYTVRIRDAANPSCIRTIGTFTVFGPEPITGQISVSPITCHGGTGILRIVNVQGGSGQYRFSIDGGNTWYTSNVFSVEAGQYDIRIQDLNFPNCRVILNSSYAVDQPAPLSARVTSENVTGCAGNANGSITVSAPTGGSGQYEYSFDGGVTWSANPRVTLIRAGFYDVRIRDARDVNCVRVLNGALQISEPTGLRADFQKVDLTCYGAGNGSITFLNPQGGSGTYEYSIDGGLTWRNTTTFTGLNGGVYDLRIRSFGNPTCAAVVNPSVTIFEPTELNTTVLTTNVTGCDATNNGAITFTNSVGGSGNYQYSVSGGGWVNVPVISGLPAGFYTVRIRDAANPTCIKTIGTFTIFSPPPLTATIRANPIECNGGFTTLTIVNPSGGSGSYRFSINGGADWFSSNSFNVRAGIYDVRIQDANFPQCTQVISGNFNISQPQPLNATVTVVPVTGCAGNRNGSITFSNPTGGTGLYRYSIDGGVNWFQNNNFTNLPAGRYSVAIEDLNTPGCFRVLNANLLVNEPDPLSGQVSSVNVTGCAGNANGQIVITNPLGGSGNYRFSIDGGQQWFASPIFTGLRAGTYSVRMYDVIQPTCIRVLDANLVITEPEPLNADVQVTDITCFGRSDGQVVITNPRGGSERYEFSIDGETWRENTFQGVTFTGIGPGRYNILMRDFNERNCVRTLRANVLFTEPAPLVASVTTANVTGCFGNLNGVITFTGVAGGSGQYQYSFDGGQTWFAQSSFNTLPAGTYTAMVRDARFNDCMVTVRENIVLTQPQELAATVVTTNVSGCSDDVNGSIEFRDASGGSGSYQYSINGGQTWQNGTRFTNLPAGVYAAAIRDANNPSCVRILSGSVNLVAPAPLTATVTGFSNSTCNNSNTGSITLGVTGGTEPYSFRWSNGATTQNLANITPGTYTVTVTDANGCTTTASQRIEAIQTGIGPDVVAVWENPSCAGTNTGSITASAVIIGRVPIPTFEYSLDMVNWQRSNFFSNLAPGPYTVYARVVGEFCVGSYNLTITTGAGPSQVTVSNITQTSAVVTWNPPAGASTYNVRYRVINTTTWTTIANVPTSSVTLTGLQAGTTYEVQVQVVCQSGITSSFGESVQFTTQAGGGACPTPGGLAVTPVNSTTVRVSWSPSNGAVCYIISWGLASSNANTWPTQTVPHPNTSFQITGLTPNLNYQVRIRANCSACSPFSGTRSNWSSFVNFTTTQGRVEITSVHEEVATETLSEVKVYPNPNQGAFTVSFEAAEDAQAHVSLHDLAGRRVYDDTVRVQAGSNQLPIQLNDVPAGLYFLRLQVGSHETAPIKIIVH